jgi:hypothetical protein
VLRLGYAAEEDAKKQRPVSSDIIVIYNAADDSVNNSIIEEFIERWRTHAPKQLVTTTIMCVATPVSTTRRRSSTFSISWVLQDQVERGNQVIGRSLNHVSFSLVPFVLPINHPPSLWMSQ